MNIRTLSNAIRTFTTSKQIAEPTWLDLLDDIDAMSLEEGDVVTVHYRTAIMLAVVKQVTMNSMTDVPYVHVIPLAVNGDMRLDAWRTVHYTLVQHVMNRAYLDDFAAWMGQVQ